MKHKQKDNTFLGQVISKRKITNFDETQTNETHAQQNNTLVEQRKIRIFFETQTNDSRRDKSINTLLEQIISKQKNTKFV